MAKEEIGKETLDDELLDLESLIRDGIDNRTPIAVELPDGRMGSALIRPLSAQEWNTCVNMYIKTKRSLELSIVEKGLLTAEEKPFPKELIGILPSGTVTQIFLEVQKISGVKRNKEEEKELTKQIFDF